MSAIQDYFSQAQLALAAYANLQGGNPNTVALQDGGMSLLQANRFASEWTVVTQFKHSETHTYVDETGSTIVTTSSNGLSATVFQDKSGKRYLAVRGTDDLNDVWTDITDVAILGTPARQAQYAMLKEKVSGWIRDGVLPANFSVTGHSLGGFLAGALLVDFPTAIEHAYLYNAPGVGGLVASLRLLLGLENDPSIGLSKVSNLRADAGISPIAGLGLAWGTPIPIAIENQLASDVIGAPAARNHSQQVLVDALAVYWLFDAVQPGIDVDAVSTLIKAASSKASDTLETSVFSLGKLFLLTPPSISTTDRNTLYKAIYDIRVALSGSVGTTFVSLTAKTADSLKGLAINGDVDAKAYRYALKELNPFAVLGIDYSRFNQNGELDLNDSASGQGDLSTNWIDDRSAMLAWVIKTNLADSSNTYVDTSLTGNWSFVDRSTGQVIHVDRTTNTPTEDQRRQIVFGTDTTNPQTAGADKLTGGALDDRLYGMSGDDVLEGKAGNDYLEGGRDDDLLIGGAGNDILNGGQGYDTYVWESTPGIRLLGGLFATNDGNDQIIDSDRRGRIVINGSGIDVLIKQTATTWATADGKVTLTQGQDTTMSWKLTMDGGGSIDLGASFSDGDYGITRTEAATGGTLIRGDLKPILDSNDKLQYDALGNVIVDATKPAPGREDRLYGSESGDTIRGLAGNDIINGNGGNDLIEGGTGSDILIGDAGKDTEWAETALTDATPLATALAGGETDTNQTTRGDWVDGQSGDDLLVGSAAQDLLSGGADNDLLIGGAGNDLLLGDAALTTANPDWSVIRSVEHNDQTNSDTYRWTLNQGATSQNDSVGGADVLYGGKGNDWAMGGAGDDLVDGGSGDDVLFGDAGNDILLGGTGADIINGDSGELPENLQGDDWIDGGDGNDRIWGMAGDDVIIGGKGDDTIVGGKGRDTYIYNKGDGIDEIWDDDTGAEASVLVFGEGVDKNTIKLRKGSLLLDMGSGDAIHIENWDQAHPLDTQTFASFQFADGSSLSWSELLARGFDLDGTEGDDTIFGTGVDDRINGKGGNDVIYGLDGNDTITGGTGTDAINGGLGDDTYLVRAGDAPVIAGATPIVETLADDGGTDTLKLQGIALTNVSLATDQTGSYLMLAAGADKLLIQGGGDGAIDRFEFGSGEILTLDQLLEQKAVQGVGIRNTVANANITGTWADDQIVATGNGAVVDGGRGKDSIKTLAFGATITGGKGADTIQAYGINNMIRYAVGDGTDSVETTGGNAQGNVLQLSGVTASELTLGLGSQGELELRVGSEAKDLIRFKGFDAVSVTANKAFDRIEFDDGSMLSYEALMSKGFDIAGSDAAETITGTGVADRVAAGAGDDVLDGGAGNDSLNGGAGRDSYRLGLGTGQDKVTESAGEISDIRLDADLSFANLKAVVSGADAVLSVRATGDSLRLADYAGSNWQIVQSDGARKTLADVLAQPNLTGVAAVQQVWADARLATLRQLNEKMNAEGWTQTGTVSYTTYGPAWLTATEQTNTYQYHYLDTGLTTSATSLLYSAGVSLAQPWNSSMVSQKYVVNYGVRQVQAGDGYTQVGMAAPVVSGLGGHLEKLTVLWGSRSNEQVSHTSGVWITYPANGYTEWDTLTDSWNQQGRILSSTPVASVPSGQYGVPTGNQVVVSINGTKVTESLISEVLGTAANNVIDAGGNVWGGYYGADHVDLVDGGAGDDTLLGDGSDVLYGNDGNDQIFGNAGAQTLIGGRGNDFLDGFSGGDIYRVLNEDGVDTIQDLGNDDVDGARYAAMGISPEDRTNRAQFGGKWQLWGVMHYPSYSAAATWAANYGYDINQLLADGELVYVEPLPALSPLQANDYRQLEAWYGNAIETDRVILGEGIAPDNIRVSGNDDTGYLLIDMPDGTGLKVALAKAGDALGTGVELFEFADGTVLTIGDLVDRMNAAHSISGSAGDDSIVTGAGNDVLNGGVGNDTLIGGGGDDVYLFRRGDGQDLISQSGAMASDHDIIRFADDIVPGDVVVTRDADGVHLTLLGGNDSIGILQQPGEAPLPAVEFADGTRWDAAVFAAAPLHVVGTLGDDILVGTAGIDVMEGGTGNDSITGGAGDDVFLFGRGDGADTLYMPPAGASDHDLIRFKEGVAPGDVVLSRDWYGLHIAIAGSSDSILIPGQFGENVMPGVAFADGTMWDASALKDVRMLMQGTAGADTLIGGYVAEKILGLAGNDSLWGYGGDDLLQGGDGNDQLYGGVGNDILDGGAGNDRLASEAGDDVYLFGRGDGADTVSASTGSGGSDTLRFKPGVAPRDVTLVKYYGGYKLTINDSGDSIQFGPGVPLTQVAFPNGTAWGASVLAAAPLFKQGSAVADSLAGTPGADYLQGLGGDDLLFGDGGNDVLDGGIGNDSLWGDAGNDIFLFGRGDGIDNIYQAGALPGDDDVICFKAGVRPSDVVLTRDGVTDYGGVRLTIQDSGDSIGIIGQGSAGFTTYNVPRVEFADGTVWDASVLRNVVATFSGSSGNDSIVGTSGADVFSGLQGNDWLYGGAGNDTYVIGSGSPLVHIVDSSGQDTLVLQGINPGDISLGVGSLKITVNATGQQIHLDDFDPDNPYAAGGIELFRFADGSVWTKTQLIDSLGFHPTGTNGADSLSGTALDDTMLALDGEDVLNGRGGNDLLDGGPGNDTYRFDIGGGHDRIMDAAGTDRIVFGAGIAAAQVTVSRDNGDVVLALSSTDSIRFTENGPGSYAIERVEFADGTAWNAADVLRALSRTPPTVAVALVDQAAMEDAAFQFAVPTGSFADADAAAGDMLSYAAGLSSGAPLPAWLVFDPATRMFSGTPLNANVGSLGLTVTATDLSGASASSGFNLTVTNTNDAPLLAAPLSGVQTNAGTLFSWSLPAGTFVDPDAGDVLGYSASLTGGSALPGWLGFDAATGTLSGTPGPADAGALNVAFTATDSSGAAAVGSLVLTVVSTALTGQTFIGMLHADTLTGTAYDDVFDGRGGADMLIGRGGDDLYLVTDQKDRIIEEADGGFDSVWADSGFTLPDQVEALAFVGADDYAGNGNGLGNLLVGNRGDNRLDGKAGDDILLGRAGDDTLLGGTGLDALDGGSGDDVLEDGDGAGFIAGGRGDDRVRLGGGADVIAFNRGDGADRIQGGDGQNDSLSLGSGIRVADIRLQKSGKDLIVNTGNGDSLQFVDWYKNAGSRTIATLQVASNAGGTLFDRYDFSALVQKFDAVLAANRRIDSWTLGGDASRFKLGSASGDVAGGTLAAAYASTGTLDSIRPETASAALATPRSDATAASGLPDVPVPPQSSHSSDGHADHHDDDHGDRRNGRDDRAGTHEDTNRFLSQREVEAAWQSWQYAATTTSAASPIDYAMGWARLRDQLAGRLDEGDRAGAWCDRAGALRQSGFSPASSILGGFAAGSSVGLPGTVLKPFEGLKEGFERLR